MTQEVFSRVLEISISATFLILVVWLIRPILSKSPKWTMLLLWILVATKLSFPYSIKSEFSVLPEISTSKQHITKITLSDTQMIPKDSSLLSQQEIIPIAKTLETGLFVPKSFSWIWVIGLCFMLLFGIFGYIRLRWRLRESVKDDDGIWLCDFIDTPFVLGILQPKIYLPSDHLSIERKYILAHEQAHLKRGDNFWKPFGYILLCIYWFHPLVWVSWFLFCQDIEKACDEKVVKNWNLSEKKAYAEALLSCSLNHRTRLICPLAFGETGIKKRIKAILNNKKPAPLALTISFILCLFMALCFLTDPNKSFSYDPKSVTDLNIINSRYANTQIHITDPSQIEALMQSINSLSFRRGFFSINNHLEWTYLIKISGEGFHQQNLYIISSDTIKKGIFNYFIESDSDLLPTLNQLFFYQMLEESIGNNKMIKYSDLNINFGAEHNFTLSDQVAIVFLIIERFDKFKDCVLYNISYDKSSESLTTLERINSLAKNRGWDVNFTKSAEFLSNFHTPMDAEEWGSFNANFDYENWRWVLGCTDDGTWYLVDQGY